MESNPATRSVVFRIRSIEDATATNIEPISLDLEMNNLAGFENGWLSRKRLGAMSQKLQIDKRKACPVCLERRIEKRQWQTFARPFAPDRHLSDREL
jgi:hypothetical protein